MIYAADPTEDLDSFFRDMEQYAKLGIDLVEVRDAAPDPPAKVRELGDKVTPRLSEIGRS